MQETDAPPGLKAFSFMWFGQLVSLIGSGLTRFAVGVWVYQRHHSATEFTLIMLFSYLPGLVSAPHAGALVDRWDRRWTMFFCNLASGAGVLAIVLLVRAGALQVWQIYLVVGISSIFNSFQWPAYIAATTQMVPKAQLGRANGLMQFGQASAEVLAPVLAGLLIAVIGMAGIVLVDFATFVFAAVTLLLVRIPRPAVSGIGMQARGSLTREAAFGWTFIRERPGLFGLLVYFAMINLVFSVCSVLATPLVLSFATSKVLASVLAVSGSGLLAGSVVMTVTGGPKPRIHGVLAFGFLFSAGLALIGLRPSAPLVAAGLFIVMFGAPIINGSSQAIWQTKVPPDLQGRVFAVRRLIAQFTAPVGFLGAGPLADYVFKRDIGLLYLTLAFLPLLASLWGYSQPRLRRVEEELPDAVSR